MHGQIELRATMVPYSRLLALLCLAAACGDSGSSAPEEEWPEASSGKKHDVVATVAVDALPGEPAVNDCITDVSAGDHKFTCDGITYLVMVHPQCLEKQCGLIFDIHGATMSGLQMRDNTLLHEIAPQAGFIYVNPSKVDANTGGTWDLTRDPPKVGAAFDKVIAAFKVNPKRIHVTGFSQGGFTTFWFLQNKNAVLASAAPFAGALEQPDWATDAWQPRVPMLIVNGSTDSASQIAESDAMVETFVSGFGLTGGDEIAGDAGYAWKKWTGAGMDLEYIVHEYGGQAVLAGHCIPGGIDVPGAPNNFSLNATTCTTGGPYFSWGDTVLKWFIDHPKS
jgi:predicted esterase